MSARRHLVTVTVALLTALALSASAGCGGDDDPSAASTRSTSATSVGTDEPDPEVPTETALQQPRAEETIKPEATLTAVPGASELPVAGMRTIQGFPVPPGAKVKDPGSLDETWQFDIHADDLDGLIDFYKRVLPQMGFRVRLGVSYTLGNEDVYWDLVFDGRISGSMVRDPDNGLLFVVVNPPGQPAIAGED